jgi:hypothetical protein
VRAYQARGPEFKPEGGEERRKRERERKKGKRGRNGRREGGRKKGKKERKEGREKKAHLISKLPFGALDIGAISVPVFH